MGKLPIFKKPLKICIKYLRLLVDSFNLGSVSFSTLFILKFAKTGSIFTIIVGGKRLEYFSQITWKDLEVLLVHSPFFVLMEGYDN